MRKDSQISGQRNNSSQVATIVRAIPMAIPLAHYLGDEACPFLALCLLFVVEAVVKSTECMCASTSRLLSCTGSNNSLSVGLIDVVPWGSRRKNAYLVDVSPAVVEHAESDVFMIHPITQGDFDNCCDPNAVSLGLLVIFNLEGWQISQPSYAH